jgi:hypothetical protein
MNADNPKGASAGGYGSVLLGRGARSIRARRRGSITNFDGLAWETIFDFFQRRLYSRIFR